MKVYPVPGRKVRDPVTKRVLTEEGLDVHIHDFFWARRLRDGDVTETEPTAAEASTEKAEAPAEANTEEPAAAVPAAQQAEGEKS